MNLLGYRAFSTELLKIATEVRDADIRAMLAEGLGKPSGTALATNSEEETNFKPKLAAKSLEQIEYELALEEWQGASPAHRQRLTGKGGRKPRPEEFGLDKTAVSSLWLKKHLVHGAAKATDQRLGGFTNKMKELSSSSKHVPIRAQANLSANFGKSTLNNRGMAAHFTKTEKTAGFMGYTPPSAYNWRGKAPTGKSAPYETGSNFASTALKGGMTGAGAATLGHTLMRGHEAKIAPKHLGAAVAIGGGVALADRALRRHAVMKANKQKTAMFSPARELHATQTQGSFEPKVHHTPLKPMAGIIGRPTGA